MRCSLLNFSPNMYSQNEFLRKFSWSIFTTFISSTSVIYNDLHLWDSNERGSKFSLVFKHRENSERERHNYGQVNIIAILLPRGGFIWSVSCECNPDRMYIVTKAYQKLVDRTKSEEPGDNFRVARELHALHRKNKNVDKT